MKSFKNFHPMVILVYYLTVMVPIFFIMDLWVVLIALIAGIIINSVCKKKSPFGDILLAVIMTFVMTVVNAVTVHSGSTELFFVAGRAITAESLRYGMVTGIMLSAVFIWFESFNFYLGAEKLMQAFFFMKKTGLLISMVIRLVPEYIRRFKTVKTAMEINEPAGENRAIALKCVSATFTWAIENSMENATGIIRRGYYNSKKTVIRQKISRGDVIFLAIVVLLQGRYFLDGIPKLILNGILCFLPVLYEGKEQLKWKLFTLKK